MRDGTYGSLAALITSHKKKQTSLDLVSGKDYFSQHQQPTALEADAV